MEKPDSFADKQADLTAEPTWPHLFVLRNTSCLPFNLFIVRSFGAWVSTRPTAERMYRHGGGLLAISALSSVFLELLSHQKSLRCHANCSVVPPGHVCATDCILDKCWDELRPVFKEKIIDIVIRVFSGPCRCGITGCKWITCSLNSNIVL